MDDFDIKKELRKALHRSLAAAYHGGNKTVMKAVDGSNSNTLKQVVNDLKDPNSSPQVDPALLPVDKEAVLTKEDKSEPNAVAQEYDITQDQKKAAMGMMSKPETHVKQPKALSGFMAGRAQKMEKASEHGVPGKNRDLHERGIHPVVTNRSDVKDGKLGRYHEDSLAGARAKRGDVEGAKRAHKEIIGEMKAQPKPNLGKGEKPLLKPYSSDAQRRWAHTEKGTKALGGKAHVHEWDEATKGKKLPEHVAKSEHEKGVHKPIARTSGTSKAGMYARSAASVKPYKDHSGETRVSPRKKEDAVRARGYHSDVRHEMRNMPNPKLGKSDKRMEAAHASHVYGAGAADPMNDRVHPKAQKKTAVDKVSEHHHANPMSNPVKHLEKSGDPTHGIRSAQHGLKAAAMKVKHEHEKAKLAEQKPEKSKQPFGTTDRLHHTGKNMPMGQVARKQALAEFRKQPPRDLGKDEADGGMIGGLAMSQHKKPTLDKAKVDQGKPIAEKVQAREARNARFPKNWVTKNPKHEGQFAGNPKSQTTDRSGVHQAPGAFQIGTPGSFRDKGGARDKIDVQAAHTMAMKGLKRQKPMDKAADEGINNQGGIGVMEMSENKPRLLGKIAARMKAKRDGKAV